jgi:TIR domain
MWDVFISHASEDKQDFVRPMADTLKKYGLEVWYDEFSLSVGDSLSRSIDKGLANSNFGVVVLSPAFLSKDWPEYELRGLTAKEIGSGKVILPIWHNLSRLELLKYSPTLADKFALNSADLAIEQLCLKLTEIIRPELFTKIHRRLRWEEYLRTAPTVLTDIRKIKQSPIKHTELPLPLVGRVRLLRAALWGVHTHSMDVWMDGFKRDLHPDKEIEWWEHLAACYLEFVRSRRLSEKQMSLAFSTLFQLCNGISYEKLKQKGVKLGIKNFEILCELPKYRYPILDVEDSLPEERLALPEGVEVMMNAVAIDDVAIYPDENSK